MIIGGLCTGLFALCVDGCGPGEPEPDKVLAREPVPYVPQLNTQNAFDAYAFAAQDAERLAPTYVSRVYFFPDQKQAVAKAISTCMKTVKEATKRDCDFKFVPHRPFKAAPYQNGWRLIGRVFKWNVETACTAADYDTALSNAVIGTKFAFGLTGGGATDASLGLAIADEIRKAIAPYLAKMSPVQLDRLAQGIKEALLKHPPILDTLKNEHENMLQSLQYIQDQLKSDNLKTLQDNMGPDVNEAIRFMTQIRANALKRKVFFTDLEKACEEEYSAVEHDSSLPQSKRLKPKTDFNTQWKKLPKHVLGTLRPLIEMNDATMARTRLLILYSELLKFGKENKPYPADLTGFSQEITLDPFSDAPFLYHADQAEFSLYSVGANGRDDGGDSDEETYTYPDLKLECSGQ